MTEQEINPVLARAIELHEKSHMPMCDAVELAASEVGYYFKCIKPDCDAMGCVMCNCAVRVDIQKGAS